MNTNLSYTVTVCLQTRLGTVFTNSWSSSSMQAMQEFLTDNINKDRAIINNMLKNATGDTLIAIKRELCRCNDILNIVTMLDVPGMFDGSELETLLRTYTISGHKKYAD